MSSYYTYSSRGLYRSRDGILFGVCKGIADFFDLSVFWIRMITVIIAFVIIGFFPTVALYILAALLMRKEPRYYY